METKVSKNFELIITMCDARMMAGRRMNVLVGELKINGVGYYHPFEDQDFKFDYDVNSVTYINLEEPPVESDNLLPVLKFLGHNTIKTIEQLHNAVMDLLSEEIFKPVIPQNTPIDHE